MLQLLSVSHHGRLDSCTQRSTASSASAASLQHPSGSREALERDGPQFLFTSRESKPTLERGGDSHHVTDMVVLGWGSGSMPDTCLAYVRLGTISYHLRRNNKTQVKTDTFPSCWGRKKKLRRSSALIFRIGSLQGFNMEHGSLTSMGFFITARELFYWPKDALPFPVKTQRMSRGTGPVPADYCSLILFM